MFKLGNQRPNVRQQLNRKLIAMPQILLGVLRSPHARRRAREDDSAGRQRCSLGEETDQLRHGKD